MDKIQLHRLVNMVSTAFLSSSSIFEETAAIQKRYILILRHALLILQRTICCKVRFLLSSLWPTKFRPFCSLRCSVFSYPHIHKRFPFSIVDASGFYSWLACEPLNKMEKCFKYKNCVIFYIYSIFQSTNGKGLKILC